jgi:small conductance mechanosensitive channel
VLQQNPDVLRSYGIKLAIAVAIFVLGKWLARILSNFIERAMTRQKIDPMVGSLTKNISYFTRVIISALGQLGIQTASFVVIIGSAGLAVGFALQGSLSNFASGVLLILLRPFRIGDFVEAGGTSGVAHEISIFSTIFKTPDNKTVIVSNSSIMGRNIINQRRVDVTVGVSYEADLAQVKEELRTVSQEETRLVADKDVTIAVSELADSSVNLVFRVWVNSADYWGVYFDLTEKIKLRFDEKGIAIPYPQMDVHVISNANA